MMCFARKLEGKLHSMQIGLHKGNVYWSGVVIVRVICYKTKLSFCKLSAFAKTRILHCDYWRHVELHAGHDRFWKRYAIQERSKRYGDIFCKNSDRSGVTFALHRNRARMEVHVAWRALQSRSCNTKTWASDGWNRQAFTPLDETVMARLRVESMPSSFYSVVSPTLLYHPARTG